MLESEFDEIIEELVDSYGQNHFPPKVVGRIWAIFKNLTKEEFRNGLDLIIEETPYAPTIARLRKALKAALDKNNANDRMKKMEELRKDNYCQVCGCGGLVNAISASNGLNYSYRCCYCQAANILRLSTKIPTWTEERRSRFFLMTDNNFPKAKETQNRIMLGVSRAGRKEYEPDTNLKSTIDDLCKRFSM